MMNKKTYSGVLQLNTFEDRLLYLQTHGQVGFETFGPYRYLVERFLHSGIWLDFRNKIILRDNGCDLAMEGYKIRGQRIIVHHIDPCTVDDIINENYEKILDPENVISTSHSTHEQIHYGSHLIRHELYKPRQKNDTCPWRQ